MNSIDSTNILEQYEQYWQY